MAKTQKFIIDNWDIGLSNQQDRRLPTGQFYVGDGVDIYSSPGYILPSISASVITSSASVPWVLSGSPCDICVDGTNSDVYLQTGTELYQITAADTGAFNGGFGGAGNYAHTVVGSVGQVGHCNMALYPLTASTKLFYTHDVGTTFGNMGMYDLSTTFDDDWLSAAPTNAAKLGYYRHPLMEWNSYLWIGNGRWVAKLDGQQGADGTLDASALGLPVGWEILKFFPTNNYLGIMAWEKGDATLCSQCRAYFWDGTSDDYAYYIPIQENSVYDVINRNGEILFVARGREPQGVLYRLIDYGVKKIMAIKHYINGIEVKSAATYPNAMASQNNLLLIGNSEYGESILAYGQKDENSPMSFSMPYKLSTGTEQARQIRAIKPVTNNLLYVSHMPGLKLSKIDLTSTTRTTASYKAGYTDFGQKIRLNYVKFYFKPLVSGDSITVGVDLDYGTSIPFGNITYTLYQGISSKKFVVGKDCHSFRPTITWNTGAVAISKIVFDYQFISDDN